MKRAQLPVLEFKLGAQVSCNFQVLLLPVLSELKLVFHLVEPLSQTGQRVEKSLSQGHFFQHRFCFCSLGFRRASSDWVAATFPFHVLLVYIKHWKDVKLNDLCS